MADAFLKGVIDGGNMAECEEGVDTRAINGLEGWIECFPKVHLAGTVFAGGVNGVGEIDGHSALIKAYEMGKAV